MAPVRSGRCFRARRNPGFLYAKKQEVRTSFNGLTDDQKAYYATTLAGKEGMSGLISLFNLTQKEYDKLPSSMNNCTGVAGETAAVMQDDLQSKVERLGGALESRFTLEERCLMK